MATTRTSDHGSLLRTAADFLDRHGISYTTSVSSHFDSINIQTHQNFTELLTLADSLTDVVAGVFMAEGGTVHVSVDGLIAPGTPCRVVTVLSEEAAGRFVRRFGPERDARHTTTLADLHDLAEKAGA